MSKYYDISNLLDMNGEPITLTFENKNIMKINEILNNINSKYEDYYVQDIVSGDDLKLLLDYIIKIREYYNANVDKYEDLIVKYSYILDENQQLKKQKYKKLQSNWNSLREWLKTDEQKYFTFQPRQNGKILQAGIKVGLDMVLDKMNELEKRNKNE